ncbi:hypothetical protein Tco_0822418 [Tanacetum coccineum]|uniref:Uncharacterized protein n=1 Tax=Tanacetum coccineum TaxID=301880 RepID=A0ABQ5AGT7_9ASTR
MVSKSPTHYPCDLARTFRVILLSFIVTNRNPSSVNIKQHYGCLDTRKSTSGGIQFLGGDKLISGSSKKQDCTSMSTTEAEYVSLSTCCAQVLWMRTQLIDNGFHFDKIPMYCDSKAAISISCNPVQHSRTKHIDVRYHFIKEQFKRDIVELFFVGTEYQLDELFTKALIDQGVGSTSGIRACALRNFDLGKMELENSQNNALAKLPMLKLGEYEMWEIRIKQYFQIQDYALWEVIENGRKRRVPIPITAPESGPSTALKMTVPSTTEEKICKKNDVKARSLLLMALLNEHQLTFNQYADAQSMFIAIKARFGGNDATKKTQKALLKQQMNKYQSTSSES